MSMHLGQYWAHPNIVSSEWKALYNKKKIVRGEEMAALSLICSSSKGIYRFLRLFTIILFGVLVYSNTFSVPFSFDDAANLQNNSVIQNLNFDGIRAAFRSRRAFGIISFQLNYFFGGWNVIWFHVTNLSIHIAAALTLSYLLNLLLKTPYAIKAAGKELLLGPLPFMVALIFTVHPVQTQAVTYIVQRFTSLATLLYLVAIVLYLRMRLVQVVSCRYNSFESIACLGSFLFVSLLAFLTKEITYTLPLAIILIELLFFDFSLQKMVQIGAGSLALTTIVIFGYLGIGHSFDSVIAVLDETTRVQTITSRTDYLFTQFQVVMTYIRLILCPVNQRLDYDYTLAHSFIEWKVISSFLVIVFLVVAAVWLTIKSRSTHPQLRFVGFGILWFFLTLSVESSFLPIIDLIFEHRVYLPSVGAITALTAGVLTVWNRDEQAHKKLCIVVIFVVILLGIATWNRNSVWHSATSLWEDAVSKSPNSARGWNNLGSAYIKEKAAHQALKALTRSIELDPSKADALNNIGIAIDIMGVYNDRFNRTAEMFTDPTAINTINVSSWLGEVNNNLGLAYEIIGNLTKAAEYYRNAVGYNPALTLAYYNLGIVSALVRDYPKYSEQLQILLMIDPVRAERLQDRTGLR